MPMTNLIEIVQAQNWAIVPEKLDAIHQVLAAHAVGQKLEFEAVAAPANSTDDKPYQIIDRVAVIPIHGIIAKRMNLMQQFSGGVSTELVGRDIRGAMNDPDIKAILLDVDSPGGTVDGTEALAELVYQARDVKPVIAFANGMMASAAYWFGSGAQTIITNETSNIGSIGVLQAHYDYSAADEKAGVKRTFIYAGKYKTIGNDAGPLDEDGKAYLQAGVDYLYSLFVESVAQHRNISIADALKMAEGRVFIGKQALEIGLVDQIGNFEQALEVAQSMGVEQYIFGYNQHHGASSPTKKQEDEVMSNNEQKNSPVTLAKLETEAPDLLEQIRSDAMGSVDMGPAREEGATTERENLLALARVHFGDEQAESFEAIVKSGASVEMYEAMKSAMPKSENSDAEKSGKMDEMLEALQESGAENPGAGGPVSGPQNFTEAWKSIKAERNCSMEDAMRSAAKEYPALHESFIGQTGNA